MSITLTLIAYLQGLITLDVLPNVLILEQELWEAMDELWERSVSRISEGVVVEWGGLLELRGSRLRLVNPVSGTATGLRLLIPKDKRFVGSFHTHPQCCGLHWYWV